MLPKLKFNFLFIYYFSASLILFLYSYSQIDLNLTLSKFSVWQTIQKHFQYLGYYQRPMSTAIYVFILFFFFALYFTTLKKIENKLITYNQLRNIILAVAFILVLSYPAFSYDIFNHMFTAKTTLLYHKNPYELLPMQLAGFDPWINFMRWIHVPSIYTPLWIFLTLPAYLLGLGYFLPVLWNIKIIIAIFYLLCAFIIERILKLLDQDKALVGVAIFALNPLIIIEFLVSAHNDLPMMFFALLSLYLYLKKRNLSSFFALAISIAFKQMTIFLIPVFLFKWKRMPAAIIMLIGILLVSTRREILPWYLAWVLPFIALLPEFKALTTLSIGVSLGLLLSYVPYLYFGNWDKPVPSLKLALFAVPSIISVIVASLSLRFANKNTA